MITVLLFCVFICFFQVSTEPVNKCNALTKLFKSTEYCTQSPPYNPDQYLDVPQIIARHGYNAESHIVTTEDGYLLQLHRIRGRKGGTAGQPVFLQHGLLGSSADWLINGNNSFGFLLADKGYDVWLGNARGNTYSTGHVSFPLESAQFWNFSFHEMGTKDLPAALYYVSNVTQMPGEILYVGHSMGTTMFFVLSSLRPQAAKNIKAMVALAPVAYMTHIKSPIRYLAPFSGDMEWLAKHLGINRFLPDGKLLRFLAYDCELFNIDKKICENVIFTICGFDKEEFNSDILPVVLSKDPAGASTKTIIHYSQEIRNDGNFQQFDYGPEGNIIEYGTKFPPKYDFSKMTRPIYLMYAVNDWLASYIDAIRLSHNLKNLIGVSRVKMDSFNHVDFLFGKDAEKLVYQPVIKILANYTMY